jgi:hypothetical protein
VESVVFINVLQDMVAPEEVIPALSKPTTTALMTPAATVRDTNPRTSRRRILIPPVTPAPLVEPTPLVKPTPLATPTPPVTPIPPAEVTVEVVRRKAGTTPLATAEEVTSLTAATTEEVMVAEAITVRVMAKNIVIRNITMTMTRPMVLRD